MKRFIFVAAMSAAILVTLPPVTARAEMEPGEHRNGALGFHNEAAPIGVRWWTAGQKVGIDLGFGFGSDQAPLYSDEKVSNWAIEAGIPFVLHSWSRAHFIVRPGLVYTSQQVLAAGATGPPVAFDTENATTMSITGELEAEVFLVDNVSISASHGIAFNSFNPAGPGDTISSFTTFGNNFTTIGFHVYLFGGGSQ
jgi:hypothetical protein